LSECVKCGKAFIRDAAACDMCSWPLTRGAWSSSKCRIFRVTLDTSCVNAKGRNPDLNTLERWAAAGHLALQRSAEMLKELQGEAPVAKASSLATHPDLFSLDANFLGSPDVLAGPDIPQELRQILFPTAKPLTENQGADVEHLRLHVRTGGDVFVTLNPNDFITRGRQEALSSFGIWVLSPAELVGLLKELYGREMELTDSFDYSRLA